ncbi:hypothetical protein [Nocardioides sp. Arc9.136]|uniref:hypothetical protein n=1 Tax=Nocardioides sp. Arc9.136 TaxID=2996826 RepID=UPI002665C95F|nr:hypothetical protein [Nocardioides sp. Arc9.136]WKN49877.1 hypothetical protein OSR43_07045 [Nocardioides sp. Arc9.136]
MGRRAGAGVLGVLGCLALVASACAEGSSSAPAPAAEVQEEVLVSCGGDVGWRPSTMAEGVPGVLTEGETREAFQDVLDDPRTGAEAGMSLFRDGIGVDWRVLAQDGPTLVVGIGRWTEQGPATDGAFVLELRSTGGGWSAEGWGDCGLRPLLPDGASWARVERYRSTGPTSLAVEVSEVECTSGRAPDPFLREPAVVETAESVVLTWTSTPAEGGQRCPGNPWTTVLVELAEPLGSREVLDGSVHPPRRLTEARSAD